MQAEERFRSLSDQPFRVYGDDARRLGLLEPLRQILRRRELLGLIVRRDIKSRYKDSALGLVWTLVRPLTQLVIYYVVIGKFLRAADSIPDFAIYVFTGLTAYGLFSEAVASGTASIVGNVALVKKVALPREIFPLASLGGALFTFAIQVGILLGATLILGVFPLHVDLLYAIPATLLLTLYAAAFALALAAANVYLRDVGYLTDVALMVLMWASPILYSWGMVRDLLGDSVLLNVLTNNPVTLGVLGMQRAFWMSGADAAYPPDLLLRMVIAGAVGAVMLILAQRIFSRLQGNFAQML